MRIITLLTDFGSADPFVGIMKGVILGINSRVHVVDLCHGVAPQDILEAAFLLHCSYGYFPKNTIHVVVVDPGVGGRRKPLLAAGKHGYYLAPDNGVLSYLYASGEIRRVVEITGDMYFLQPVSPTFHGRDIFAPVAAHLSRGAKIESFGRRIETYTRLTLPAPRKRGKRALEGIVLHVDRFGNLITNVSSREIAALHPDKGIAVSIKNRTIRALAHNYESLKAGEVGAILGSTGYLEIFSSHGSASRALKVGRGAEIRVEGETVQGRRGLKSEGR